ncbi:MAG: hypothetical protein RLZZ267_1268 [Bacillota bacterium]|jgi:hypothetical protein
MDLRTAIHSWLQIRIVSEARPEDDAAKKTFTFFEEIVSQDFGVTDLTIMPYSDEDHSIELTYKVNGEHATISFDREMTVKLLQDIEENPKYQ